MATDASSLDIANAAAMPWRPSGLQAFAVLFGGAVALLITGLQPLILGGLAEAGRLGGNEIGLAAAAELLALGAATSISGVLLKPNRLRAIGLIAALVHAGATLATMAAVGIGVILLRGLAGLAAGVMLWITIGMIARASRPERWSGSFLTGQTLAQLAVAATLPVTVVPRFGINGALFCLAVISALAAAAALLGPGHYAPLDNARGGEPAARSRIDIRALTALMAVFALMAAVTVVFVYLEPLGLELGQDSGTVDITIAIILGFQVLGALTATAVGDRLPYIVALAGCTVLGLGAFGVFAAGAAATEFIAAGACFGFVWLFALPYQLLFLIEVDPSRRTALQMPAAQLLGSAAGPMVGSFLVSDTEFRSAVTLAAAALVIAFSLTLGLYLGRGRGPSGRRL